MSKMKRILILTVCSLGILVSVIFYVAIARGLDELPSILKRASIEKTTGKTHQPVLSNTKIFGNLPLYFIPNKGQIKGDVKFYAVTRDYTIWCTSESLIFSGIIDPRGGNKASAGTFDTGGIQSYVTRMVFPGGKKEGRVEAFDIGNHRVNTYIGKDPSRWKSGLKTSKGIRYRNLFAKTDLKIYGNEHQIEYDWIIKPGGSYDDIRFRYEDVEETTIDESGNLVIETPGGELYHEKPMAYQWINGKKRSIDVNFLELGPNTYGFAVGEFDPTETLIIDPKVTVDYSTYLGGSGEDRINDIALDSEGNLLLTGYTYSSDFPVFHGAQNSHGGTKDIFVSKLTSDGSDIIYSTFVGGSGADSGREIAVGIDDEAYIAGDTNSSDFPSSSTSKGSQEALLLVLDSSGAINHSWLLSGYDYDSAWAVATNGEGKIYVAGFTYSDDFPLKNAYQSYLAGDSDAFVSIFDHNSGLEYSTYIGGSGLDGAQAIKVSNSGSFYIAGYTRSSNFPTKNAYQSYYGGGISDGFVTKFSSSGSSIVYSTYLGGLGLDNIWSMDLDKSGYVYVSGMTDSRNYPVSNAYQPYYGGGEYDSFYTKLSTDGKSLVFSSYLGGHYSDYYGDIVIDDEQHVFVAMNTSSSNLVGKNAYSNTFDGVEDIYLAKFESNGKTLDFATYFGGSGEDTRGNMALNKSGDIFLVGKTTGRDFPIHNAYQNSYRGGTYDGYITKLTYAYDLNVTSVPGNGVSITVSPSDNNGKANGTTNFTRNYDPGKVVTLTAPASFKGKNFHGWSIDGVNNYNTTIKVTMNEKHNVEVSYYNPATISLDRNRLNFGVTLNGHSTGSQTVSITNSGGGTLNWSASPNVSWLNCSPKTGSISGKLMVWVNAQGLSVGSYSGLILITDPGATNSPQTLWVTLNVYSSGGMNPSMPPMGSMDTPMNGAFVSGSVAFTGWALDDVEVNSVKIYLKDGQTRSYVGDGTFVEGARPDIDARYPNYPRSTSAGWGYMMLTHFLPNKGNGVFTFEAIATDNEGNQTVLGSATFTCDNAHSTVPFGSLDTPTQGGVASGTQYPQFGWVLTPLPNYIPQDGSTIKVWVDGVIVKSPTYNNYRPDIANAFPGYANSNGAVGYIFLDTTRYTNGTHTIYWTVYDSAGNSAGIGSRYFTIDNNTTNRSTPSINVDLKQVPLNYFNPVKVKRGFSLNSKSETFHPDTNGYISINVSELDRCEIQFKRSRKDESSMSTPSVSNITPLPVGSTLDREQGIFYWSPGPGFVGNYSYQFVYDGYRYKFNINVIPKFSTKK